MGCIKNRTIVLSLGLLVAVLLVSTPVFAADPPGDGGGTGADNPLTTSFTLSGNLDIVVDVVPFSYATDPSGTFTISGIPGGSTVVKALVYHQEWEFSAGETALSWLTGVNLGAISPFTHDPGGAGGEDLAIYRWDVTPLVTGDGSYAFTTSGLERVFGAALVVVYSNPSLPLSEVRINDGAESMANGATASTSFFGVKAGSGKLIIYTEADNEGVQTGETISFNGAVVAGPIDENLGPHASLFDISVTTVSGTNTADVYTPTDWFGWHLAILVSPGVVEPVPEFGLSMPITTSLVAAIYLFIRKRLYKRED